MAGFALSELVEQLRGITRRTGPLVPADMADLASLLWLPVYVDDPAAPGLLLADIVAEIEQLPEPDDPVIARFLFRLEAPDLEIGDRRQAAIKILPIADTRQIRGDRENYILSQLGFALYQRAVSPARAGWNHGDGYVFTDFTQDVFVDPSLTKRRTRYVFTIHAVRNRVEFYKLGTLLRGSRRVGKPRCPSEGRTQQYVASIPVDRRNPTGGDWHIVRFNPKLAFQATPTVIIEEDTEVADPKDRIREVGLSVAGLDPVMSEIGLHPTALLRVHLPRSVAAAYDRNVYSLVGDIMDRPLRSETVVREDDSPMLFQPDPVVPERRYVIDWTAG